MDAVCNSVMASFSVKRYTQQYTTKEKGKDSMN